MRWSASRPERRGSCWPSTSSTARPRWWRPPWARTPTTWSLAWPNLIELAVPLLVGDLVGGLLDLELGGLGLAIVDGAGVDDRAALYLELDLSGLEL